MPHILELATNMPAVFKETVAQLPAETRSKLEASVRHSVVSNQQQQQRQMQQRESQLASRHDHDAKQPTILLKTDFSNFA